MLAMPEFFPTGESWSCPRSLRGHFRDVSRLQTEIDREKLLAAIDPEDRERVRQIGLALLIPGSEGRFATEFRSTGVEDGKERWLAVEGCMLFDQNMRATRMIGTVLDITERKRLEEQMRQRVEELAKLMDTAPVAILVSHDPECHEITGNRAGNEMFGGQTGGNLSFAPKERRFHDWRLFREGVAISPKDLPMRAACASGMEVRDWEAEAIMPNGTRKFLWGGATPLLDKPWPRPQGWWAPHRHHRDQAAHRGYAARE